MASKITRFSKKNLQRLLLTPLVFALLIAVLVITHSFGLTLLILATIKFIIVQRYQQQREESVETSTTTTASDTAISPRRGEGELSPPPMSKAKVD